MPWYKVTLMILVTTSITMPPTLGAEVELSKVDRSIRQEPIWKSGEPQYCLFYVNANRRIWFVVDGDDLYMDINGNGDLTEPGEKLPPLELSSAERRESRNSSHWRIPDITGIDGKPLITNIQIELDTNRGAAFGSKFVYFNIPVYGRVHTRPTFADTPADAPILHPTGPHRLSLSVRRSYLPANRDVSNTFHVDGHKCVEGLGRGTGFALETVNLDCRIEFPLTEGGIRVKEFRLRNYITGAYQTATVVIPEGVNDNGTVKITLTRRSEATGPAVEPVVVEKPLAELRAVRRENKTAAVSPVPTREPLRVDADEAVRALVWHSGGGTMVFSPDRSRRATAIGNEQTVVIRNQESGETVVTFREQPTRIYSLAFSPDRKRVASGGLDGSIKVWDATSGVVQLALEGHIPRLKGYSAIVHDVEFSPDGTQLASASADGSVKLWDAATGEELQVLRRPVRYVNFAQCLAFSPNGERLAVAYDDGTILLWDIVSGKESIAVKRKSYEIKRLAFSPDGTRLASAAHRGNVNVWDAASGEHSLRLTGHKKWIWNLSLAFSPDGKRLGLADAQPDQTVWVWDITPDLEQ